GWLGSGRGRPSMRIWRYWLSYAIFTSREWQVRTPHQIPETAVKIGGLNCPESFLKFSLGEPMKKKFPLPELIKETICTYYIKTENTKEGTNDHWSWHIEDTFNFNISC